MSGTGLVYKRPNQCLKEELKKGPTLKKQDIGVFIFFTFSYAQKVLNDTTLHITNYFFYIFHTVLIFFNLFGWISVRLRRLNLISLLLTFGSWILLGFWKGWGYCFLTDWHYRILRRLGEREMPSSYIVFLIEKVIGRLPNDELVNWCTIVLAILALVCSLWANFKNNK